LRCTQLSPSSFLNKALRQRLIRNEQQIGSKKLACIELKSALHSVG
jgi:hypothetical protein